jgi:hypothetical protein
VGKVGKCGAKCGGFYVNEYRFGICCGKFDSVDKVGDKGDKCGKRLVERGDEGKF